MTVNKLKITTMLLSVVTLVLIFSVPTILADTELHYPKTITITCNPGGPPTVDYSNLEIYPSDAVTFKINPPNCTSIFISGVSPIGNFNLTTGTPQQAKTFPNVGIFNYTITDNGQNPPQTSSSKVVTVINHYVPSLSTWGIIILIALIIVTGVYLWIRRKPVTT